MLPIKNDRLLRAIAREPVDYTPIWIMRQAGRYLPEYQKTRALAGSFMSLCQTPELACEVTLQPLRRYALDASIIFSDILTIPDAMGLGLSFVEGEGPRFAHPANTERAIHALNVPNLEQLQYVYEAIRLVVSELSGSIPLIGFAGSPWTLATYMVEGRSKSNFQTLAALLEKEPLLLHHLLEVMKNAVILHLEAQIEAGVSALMVFDTWGGLLNEQNYPIFSLDYMKQIIQALKERVRDRQVPIILFTKGGTRYIDQMANSGCDMLSIDWEMTMQEARHLVRDRTALQGNLHPEVLLKPEAVIRHEVATVLSSYGHGSGHVFNLGHGITPDVPPAHVSILVDAVHELSREYHL